MPQTLPFLAGLCPGICDWPDRHHDSSVLVVVTRGFLSTTAVVCALHNRRPAQQWDQSRSGARSGATLPAGSVGGCETFHSVVAFPLSSGAWHFPFPSSALPRIAVGRKEDGWLVDCFAKPKVRNWPRLNDHTYTAQYSTYHILALFVLEDDTLVRNAKNLQRTRIVVHLLLALHLKKD